MKSRELVKRTLEYNKPSRIPRQLWWQPWAESNHPEGLARIRKDFPDDMVGALPFYHKEPKTKGNPYTRGIYQDEWGCEFENVQAGIIGEVKQPLLQKWEDVDKVRVPEELLSIDKEKINDFCRNTILVHRL